MGSPSNRLGAASLAAFMARLVENAPTTEQLAESLGEALHEALVEAYQGECAVPEAHRVFRAVFDNLEWEPPGEILDVMLPAYFRPHYGAMRADAQAPRVLGLVREAGLRIAVIANLIYGDDLLLSRLAKLGILAKVDACVLSTQTGWLKPHPAAYREAQQRLGLPASELVMVGDDWEFDVKVPQRLGMRAIWRRRPGAALPEGVEPDAVIDRLGDVLPTIASLEARERVA